ncbi:hypothetical protein DFP72DRAFT_859177 [Ephemerocybe angulata]|uniref:Uncharacterized protein n=1 Tax=Ephemerocybe angulata TaxID=980116 RepID=A0A8H6LUL2_9AGAR|nr:hypothetical protein DFP72DRAFT_859177 [Tulosesus angulatus]
MTRTSTHLERTAKKGPDKRKIAALVVLAAAAVALHSTRASAPPRAKHNGKMTGAEWVKELLEGHPDRFQEQMGMRLLEDYVTRFTNQPSVIQTSYATLLTQQELTAVYDLIGSKF